MRSSWRREIPCPRALIILKLMIKRKIRKKNIHNEGAQRDILSSLIPPLCSFRLACGLRGKFLSHTLSIIGLLVLQDD
jgi:hypothetical protein